LAINLAYLLAGAGRRVALIDLAQFGSLELLLQVPRVAGAGLGPVAACLSSVHKGELPEVLETVLQPVKLGSHKVSLLAAAPPQRQDDLTVDGVLDVLDHLTLAGYDLVLDTSNELSDRLAGALHGATHQLWVVSPDPAAGWHLLQTRQLAAQLGAPEVPAGMIVNRFHRRCGLRLPDLEAAVGLPVWATLPDLPRKLPLAAHQGVPLLAHRSGRWTRGLTRALVKAGALERRSWWPPRRHPKEAAHGQI
jgi:cellulose biosynthesis protein BcsQ